MKHSLEVIFRGVRGSIPTPVRENLGHGGNTSCVEIRCAGTPPLLFDAGSGVRAAGQEWPEDSPAPWLFLSHLHWDHIQGLPFFRPIYAPACAITFCSTMPPGELRAALRAQMRAPYFPVEFPDAVRPWQFVEAGCEGVEIGAARVVPFSLRHPGESTGYRIEAAGAVAVYITDHEPGDRSIDHDVVRHCRDADLLVCDAQYTSTEYAVRRGWGHGTWTSAVRLALDAGVKRLVLSHHDPDRNDTQLIELAAAAREQFANTQAAREGLRITLTQQHIQP